MYPPVLPKAEAVASTYDLVRPHPGTQDLCMLLRGRPRQGQLEMRASTLEIAILDPDDQPKFALEILNLEEVEVFLYAAD